MPFRRFFERGAKREAPAADDESAVEQIDADEDVEAEAEAEPDEGEYEGEASAPEDASEINWRERALVVLPTGASTGSKRPEALYGDAGAVGPTHYISASGCRLVDSHGDSYIDCIMALGAVALGYAEPQVQQAAMVAIAEGHVSGLSHVREVDLAERLR